MEDHPSFVSQQHLDDDVPHSAPAPSSPTNESLTSSMLITVHAADLDRPINGARNPAGSGVIRGKILQWATQRGKRKAKYPAPFDRFFEQLDIWMLLAVIGAMVTGIATSRSYGLVSDECTRALILMLGFSFFFLMVAYTLQDVVPEIAIATTLTGIALVIASFHTVALHVLDPHQERRSLAICVLLVGYLVLFAITLRKIVKDDVREKE